MSRACSKSVTNPGVMAMGQTDKSACWTKNNLTHSLTLDLKLDLCEIFGWVKDMVLDDPPSDSAYWVDCIWFEVIFGTVM